MILIAWAVLSYYSWLKVKDYVMRIDPESYHPYGELFVCLFECGVVYLRVNMWDIYIAITDLLLYSHLHRFLNALI